MQRVVAGQVRSEDAQQVVGVAEKPLGRHDVGYRRESGFERRQRRTVLLAHGHENQRLEPEPDRVRGDVGAVSGDDARALQLAYSPVAGRHAERHAGSEVGEGHAAVPLQLRQNLPVNGIHEVDLSIIGGMSSKPANIFVARRGKLLGMDRELGKRVRAWIDRRGDDMADLLMRLVAIETENPPGRNLARCAEVLRDSMHGLGLPAEIIPVGDAAPSGDRPSIVRGTAGTGERVIYFHGHFDVVPAQHPSQFDAHRRDGRITGRGTADMKGGLVSLLYAAAAAQISICSAAAGS